MTRQMTLEKRAPTSLLGCKHALYVRGRSYRRNMSTRVGTVRAPLRPLVCGFEALRNSCSRDKRLGRGDTTPKLYNEREYIAKT